MWERQAATDGVWTSVLKLREPLKGLSKEWELEEGLDLMEGTFKLSFATQRKMAWSDNGGREAGRQ